MSKVALVTGGTDGVGLSLVRALARDGFDVHFIGANIAKGQQVAHQLQAQFPRTHLQFWPVDLSHQSQIQRFVEQFAAQVDAIDRLVFSAGVILPRRAQTPEGVEMTLAVNYLSAYLLAQRLQPLVCRAETPRVLLVSGGASLVLKPRLDFADLQLTRGYQAIKAAIRAVHAKAVLAQILAEDWQAQGVVVNAFNPGLIRSNLGRHLPQPLPLLAGLAAFAMAEDSKTGIRATLDEAYGQHSGYFFEGRRQMPIEFEPAYREQLRRATEAVLTV